MRSSLGHESGPLTLNSQRMPPPDYSDDRPYDLLTDIFSKICQEDLVWGQLVIRYLLKGLGGLSRF